MGQSNPYHPMEKSFMVDMTCCRESSKGGYWGNSPGKMVEEQGIGQSSEEYSVVVNNEEKSKSSMFRAWSATCSKVESMTV